MIIIIRKRYVVLSAVCCVILAGMSFVLWQGRGAALSAFSPREDTQVTVIVDAGHGGEDGGAVAKDGTVESRINLAVAQKLNDLLIFAGQTTCMTRTEDVSIHSPGTDTLHQRKVSDLQNRVALVNGTEHAVLISIHQNSLPSSLKTHGAQVFWNTVEGGDLLAKTVQQRLNLTINVGNEKSAKKITASIYLMKHVTAPAIIVECGFLSNVEETARLQEASYQRMLAVSIAAGYLACMAGGEVP